VWGRNHTIGTDVNANGYLVEAEALIAKKLEARS
jgi:hypothetical protein